MKTIFHEPHEDKRPLRLERGGKGRLAMGHKTTGQRVAEIKAHMDQRTRVFIGTMTAQGLGIQGANGLPANKAYNPRNSSA